MLLFVAEVFGDGERAERHARSRAGRLVHLAVDQGGLADDRLAGLQLGLGHLDEEVVALARALADAREAAHAAVRLGNVVDELLDEHRLADAGAPEEADLAALSVRGQEVDDLDAGLEDFDLGRLLHEVRRRPVNRGAALGADGGPVVDRVADHVEDAAEALGADGHLDGGARVAHGHPADQTIGRVHRDRAHGALAEVLRDFERQVVSHVRDAGVGQLERIEDLGQLAVGELDVDDRPDDLDHFAEARGGAVCGGGGTGGERRLGHGARVYHGVNGSSIIDDARCASPPSFARSLGAQRRLQSTVL